MDISSIGSISGNKVEMNYYDLKKLFTEHESKRRLDKSLQPLNGLIVFGESNFTKPYSEGERTYSFSSDNKAFQTEMGGYSIFGMSVEGNDFIRLDCYLCYERGSWDITNCWLLESSDDTANSDKQEGSNE